MCYEDIKLGARRYSRITTVATGTDVTIPADKNRVVLRLVYNTGAGAGSCLVGLLDDAALAAGSRRTVLTALLNWRTDEIRFETHGELVQQAFIATCTVAGAVATIIELLDNDLPLDPSKTPQPYDVYNK